MKADKKKQEILLRIQKMEADMRLSLTKKDSRTAEISLPEYQKRIAELRKKL